MTKSAGSPEFVEFLERQKTRPQREETPDGYAGTVVLPKRGEKKKKGEKKEKRSGQPDKSSDGLTVSVRVAGSKTITAAVSGFPSDWVFEHGDRLFVYQVNGRWETMPEMAQVETDGNVLTYWVENKVTKRRRRLVRVKRTTTKHRKGSVVTSREIPE